MFFERGEANKMLLDIFRLMDSTITTNQITDEVIKRKGFNREAIDIKALTACIFYNSKETTKKRDY